MNALFQMVNGLGYPSQHLVVLPEATLKRNNGIVVFDKNCYLAEAHWRASNVYDDPAYRNEWPLTDKRRLTGNWYCLMGHWGSNYNHWMWDELPRLFSALPHLPADVRFVVADDMSDFQRDTLQALGIAPERCLAQSAFGETRVERLWFATPLGHSEHATTAPDIAKKMRAVFVEKLGSQAKERKRRVFISRVKRQIPPAAERKRTDPRTEGAGLRSRAPGRTDLRGTGPDFFRMRHRAGPTRLRPDEHIFCARRLPGFGDSRAGRHSVTLLDHGLHAGTQL